jgi:hypothetical protein
LAASGDDCAGARPTENRHAQASAKKRGALEQSNDFVIENCFLKWIWKLIGTARSGPLKCPPQMRLEVGHAGT